MNEITIAAVAGAVAPWVVAVIRTPGMPTWLVRVIAIGIPALITVLGIGMSQGWVGAADMAKWTLMAVGVMQTVFTVFKEHGLSGLESRTTPGRHARIED